MKKKNHAIVPLFPNVIERRVLAISYDDSAIYDVVGPMVFSWRILI